MFFGGGSNVRFIAGPPTWHYDPFSCHRIDVIGDLGI